MEATQLNPTVIFTDADKDPTSHALLSRNAAVLSREQVAAMTDDEIRKLIEKPFQYVAVDVAPIYNDEPVTAIDLGFHPTIEDATAYYNREVQSPEDSSGGLTTFICAIFEPGTGEITLLEQLNLEFEMAALPGAWPL